MNLKTELKHLSDSELIEQTDNKVAQERELTTQVLDHLREIQSRRLYARLGFSSMFEYCTKHLKYCNASAQLRIDAMRLSSELPAIKDSLESGALSLSVVGTFQKFVRQEKSRNRLYTRDEKVALLKQVEAKSRGEAEAIFAELSPECIPVERARAISSTQSEIRFVADKELLELMRQLKSMLIQKGNPDPSFAEIFKESLKKALKIKPTPRVKKTTSPGEVAVVAQDKVTGVATGEVIDKVAGRSPNKTPDKMPDTVPSAVPSTVLQNAGVTTQGRPYIPISIRKSVLKKANFQCSYISAVTGRKCSETRSLQIEHVMPFAKGGSSEIENLAVLCPCHNRLSAIDVFGAQKMKPYLQLK